MSFLFNQAFFLESSVELEDCPTDGLLKQGLIGTKVVLETTFEFETKESNEESSSHKKISSTPPSRDAQNELVVSLGLSESCLLVSGLISIIRQLFGGPR